MTGRIGEIGGSAMVLWRRSWSDRSGRRDPHDVDPDRSYPFFTVNQAARLRAMARHALAEAGVETQIEGRHLRAGDGLTYGLDDLFALCRYAPRGERSWRAITERHLDRMLLEGAAPAPEGLTPEQVLARVALRVCVENDLPRLGQSFGYRRPLGGGLVEIFAQDNPHAVVNLTDSVVERVGSDLLRRAGTARLRREPWGAVQPVTTTDGARFHVVQGESVYTASRVLMLDEVLRTCTGEDSAPLGILVCVPDPQRIAVHRVSDRTVVPALRGMSSFAAHHHERSAGLSPHVYWQPADGGRLQRLTGIDARGRFTIVLDAGFRDVVTRLTA